MDFGNGLYLWGILAGVLPVLLHLYFKRRKHRVQFSTLLFFVKKERLFAFRRKLYELLLLALRVLLLVLLALALSRPFFKRFNFISGGSTAAVIIIDDSLSMQRRLISGGTAFSYGLKEAENILNSLAGDDEAAVIFTSGAAGVNLTRDKNLVLKALRQAALTAVPGSPGAALELAGSQLRRSPGVNREIYFISDFAAANTPRRQLSIRGLKNSRLYCLPLRGSNENVSVSAGQLDAAPKSINRSVDIPFTLTNHGQLPRQITARLEISGKTVSTGHFSLAPGAVLKEQFVYVPPRPGRVQAAVTIDDDHISLDNRTWFSFAVADELKVLLVRGRGTRGADPFYFFRLALDPAPAAPLNGIRCTTLDRGLLTAGELAAYSIVCLALDTPVDTKTARLLVDYLASGGTLLTVPDAGAKANYCAELVRQRRLPLRPVPGEVIAVADHGVKFNPPLRELNDLLELNLIRWRKLVNSGSSPARILAATAAGRPLILEQRAGKGKWLNLNFALRRNFSDWPALKSYPVAMVALMNYAAGNREKSVAAYCGAEVRLEGEHIVFSGTDGRSGVLTGTLKPYSRLPGILTFSGADLEAAVFNPNPDESKTAGVDDAQLRRWFDAPVTILNTGGEITPQIVKFRKGSDLTGWFLLLLVLLSGLEFMLGRNKKLKLNNVE
ncbi:MAG: BatA and WFA domain-containing protein [Victivallaceae bacterium]|nr:BatA and WFA domain-containing protein [Victivallaceae bacterium]